MIKINLLQPTLHPTVQKALDAFNAERTAQSFSGRNPELGKMVNCPVCDRRHRSSHTCTPIHSEVIRYDENDNEVKVPLVANQNTRKGVHGAKNFRGRILRHRNAWGLQVLERTLKIYREDIESFPNATDEDKDKLGKSSLSRALNEKRAERAARRRSLFQITRTSRQINRRAN